MTMQDAFKHVLAGNYRVRFPEVLKGAKDNVGTIQEMRFKGEKHHGIGVRFPGHDYCTWFYDSDETDKRKHYMRDLLPLKDGEL